MKLQFSIVNTPSELIDPPLSIVLALINVIPVNVKACPLAILNILASLLASMITFPDRQFL